MVTITVITELANGRGEKEEEIEGGDLILPSGRCYRRNNGIKQGH